jgi:hypothetical protein
MDPIGTVGGAPKREESDLDIAFKGGETFLARADALRALIDSNEAALSDLKLGRAAAEALKEATVKLAEANAAHDTAAAVLASAKKEAAAIVTEAEALREQAARDAAEAEGARIASTTAVKSQRAAEQRAAKATEAAEEVRGKFESKIARLKEALGSLSSGAAA